MSLHTCDDCGVKMSSSAKRCTHCGKVYNAFHIPDWVVLLGLVMVGLLVFLLLVHQANMALLR